MINTEAYVLATIKLYFAMKELEDSYSSVKPAEILALIAKIEAEAVLGPEDDEPAAETEEVN